MLSATTRRRMKRAAWVLLAVFASAVIWFAVNIYLYAQKLIRWEYVYLHMRCHAGRFSREPELMAKLSDTPLEVTGISIRSVHDIWGDPPYRDRYGNPMRFFLVRLNGQIYGKGISPGRDGKFGTEDDMIASEYDRTDTLHHIPRIDIDAPQSQSSQI